MKTLSSTLLAAFFLAGPAVAYGQVIDLPVLTFPTETSTISTQNCDTDLTKPAVCE